MTFVGRILVILIMVFALFFLAVSTVVFSTAKNWKDEVTKLRTKITDVQKNVETAKNDVELRKQELETARADFKKQTDALEARIKDATKQVEDRQKELTEQRTTVETAQETARTSLAEAAAQKKETDLLRDQLAAVQKQSNDFKTRQTELNDAIRVLNRQLETAKKNNADLRERVGLLSSVIRKNGLSDDIQQIKGVSLTPPDVDGVVTRVNAKNNKVELSIGSDDGLVVGHELEIWRTQPTPEYIGRLRIDQVEPDKSTGVVIGKTLHGKKIQEGDIVAPKIRPRS